MKSSATRKNAVIGKIPFLYTVFDLPIFKTEKINPTYKDFFSFLRKMHFMVYERMNTISLLLKKNQKNLNKECIKI